MSSTTAMFSGLSGLSTNSKRLDVIGNNIANVNTTAFKSSRMLGSSSFSQNLSLGTTPRDTTGGTNPSQIGLGASMAGVQRNFAGGAISSTGVQTDLALEGDGFFVVEQAGERFYTRAGAFRRNSLNQLVTTSGANVMGFGVDNNFNIVQGEVQPLAIPLGAMTVAEATRNVMLSGQLNASGDIATTGSVHNARAFYTNANDPPTDPMTGNEDLTQAGNNLFVLNNDGVPTLALEGGQNTILTISGVEKGGKDLGTHTFAFSNDPAVADRVGETMNDFITFLEDIFGLDGEFGGGVEINGDGQVVITGNHGTVQDLDLTNSSIVATSDSGSGLAQPFFYNREASADGESVRSSLIIYDSLGTPVSVDLTFVLTDTTVSGGTTWGFIAESLDNDADNRIVGTGELNFDSNGNFIGATNDAINVFRENGADSPLEVSFEFNNEQNAMTALSDQSSNLVVVDQDGAPIGTLSNFSVTQEGEIAGIFTNGLTRTIGQLALARFTNPAGLVDTGDNFFQPGPNSGPATITRPLEFGSARIIASALEMSNVDLSEEFINMIMASTGYSASSRVITTTNELIQQLLVLGR